MPARELPSYYWEQTGGDNPLHTGGTNYDSWQDLLVYNRQSPASGKVSPPYDVACMDERALDEDGHTIRSAGASAFSEEAQAELFAIREQIAVVNFHPGCGRAALFASELNLNTDPSAVDALAQFQVEEMTRSLGVQSGRSRMSRPANFHIARAVLLDATPGGFDPSTVTDASGRRTLPPMLTVNAGVLGQRALVEDGPLAVTIGLHHGFTEFFTPQTPLSLITLFDSSSPNGKIDPDEAGRLAESIQSRHPNTQVHQVDINARPSSRKILDLGKK